MRKLCVVRWKPLAVGSTDVSFELCGTKGLCAYAAVRTRLPALSLGGISRCSFVNRQGPSTLPT